MVRSRVSLSCLQQLVDERRRVDRDQIVLELREAVVGGRVARANIRLRRHGLVSCCLLTAFCGNLTRCNFGVCVHDMAEPRFEPHATALQAVHAAAANDNAEDTRRAPRLVVVAFLDRWSPPALATATALEAVRNSGDVNAFAHIFLGERLTGLFLDLAEGGAL